VNWPNVHALLQGPLVLSADALAVDLPLRRELIEMNLRGVPRYPQPLGHHLRCDRPVFVPKLIDDLLVDVGGDVGDLLMTCHKDASKKNLMTRHSIDRASCNHPSQ
jgi:hypothetical protein